MNKLIFPKGFVAGHYTHIELRKAFETIESKSGMYNKRIRELNNKSRQFNGIAQTVKIIESL